VRRHRFFEIPSLPLCLTPSCNHNGHTVYISGSGHGRPEPKPAEMIAALGVPWMQTRAEARQAIPPAYTEWIGRRIVVAE